MACKYKSRVWDNGWCNVACSYCTLTQESGCEHNKQTNADRIRAMTDDELEELLRRTNIGYEPWCDHHCKMNGDDNCNSCLAKWLQQPAEGE